MEITLIIDDSDGGNDQDGNISTKLVQVNNISGRGDLKNQFSHLDNECLLPKTWWDANHTHIASLHHKVLDSMINTL